MATESTARESAASRQSRVPLAGVGPDQPVRGVFRMGRSFVRLSQRNDPYRIVELVDSSGALRCYGWTAPFVHAAPIPEWSLVDVEFRSYQYQQGVAGRLSALAPAASPTPDDQLETLPATLCPVPGVVGRLIKIVAEIRTPLLREFVARVLSDPVLARAFFRVPASFVDHHAWPGGTAEHSVEMASNAARIEGLSELDRDLAIVNTLVPRHRQDRNARSRRHRVRGVQDCRSRRADPVPAGRAAALAGDAMANGCSCVAAGMGGGRRGQSLRCPRDASGGGRGPRHGPDFPGLGDAPCPLSGAGRISVPFPWSRAVVATRTDSEVIRSCRWASR